MLPRIWSLPSPALGDPGVEDVEKLCRAVLIAGLRKSRIPVQDRDFQEALAFLLGEVVVLQARYRPAPGREFPAYVYQALRWRLIDHWRAWYGRDGRHRLPGFESRLEAEDGIDDEALARGAYELGPDFALAAVASDRATDRLASFLRLHVA